MKRASAAKRTSGHVSTRLAALYSTGPQGICLQCRYRAATAFRSRSPVTYSPVITRRHASESIKDKVLKRLRGRSAEDKGLTEEEKANRKAGDQEGERKAEFEIDGQGTKEGYVPASYDDGLPRIGGITREVRLRMSGLRSGYKR